MLSLYLLDKVAKRLDFHSIAIIFLDFFDKDQTSLNITRLHSTHSTRWPNGSIFSSIFCRVKNRVKNRVVWPGPKLSLLHYRLIAHFAGEIGDHSFQGPYGFWSVGKLWKLIMQFSRTWKLLEKEMFFKMAMEAFCIFVWESSKIC